MLAHAADHSELSLVVKRKFVDAARYRNRYGLAMSILATRIKQAREEKGLSQADLAERVGMKQTSIASIEGGSVERPKKLREIARALGCDETWLLGEDEDRDHEITRESEDQANGIQPEVPAGAIAEIDVRAGLGGGGIIQHGYIREEGGLTTVDALKPEFWMLPQSFIRQQFAVSTTRLIVLETLGDSMMPTIEPNERIFVDTGHVKPSPDGIYAIRDSFGEIVVKRLQVDGSTVKVISDNHRHPLREMRLQDLDVVGKVVATIKRF